MTEHSMGDSTGEPTDPVSVWIVRLAGPVAGAKGLLGRDEIDRAARFRRAADRDRYVGAHAALRAILAAEVGAAPGALAFAREPCPLCGEPHGRPRLAGRETGGERDVHFSLSHTAGVAAVALARRPVGVDVEAAFRSVALDDLTPALHPAERQALAALPDPDAPVAARPPTASLPGPTTPGPTTPGVPAAAGTAAVADQGRWLAALRCWVRKEAYLKGLGTGLGLDPATVHVGVTGPPRPLAGWSVADVPAGPAHLAAVALATPTRAAPPAVRRVALAELLAGYLRPAPGNLPPRR